MKKIFSQVFSPIGEMLKRFFPKIKKYPVLSFVFFFFLAAGLYGAFSVFAETSSKTFYEGFLAGVSSVLLVISQLAITLAFFFLRFFINLAAYNNYIDTETVHLGWLMVRDLANMFFVVVLLVIAFMTILGAGGYEWKKSMGKLVFAAIFINFSDLICGIIIDVAHIFTMTFLSAIVQAAAGNLIGMFNINTAYQFAQGHSLGDLQLELLGAVLVVMFFSILAAYSIGAYLIVMIARVVVLWVLIILSPLAFLLQATPKGEKYASEWWSQFLNHVMAAPVMVFFLWLAFATLGNGNVMTKDINVGIPSEVGTVNESINGAENYLSAAEVGSWENMANFLIAIAFLRVGLQMVQRLNVEGGGVTQGAWNFAKNVVTVASGYTVGRKIAGYAGGKIKAAPGAALGLGLKGAGKAIGYGYRKTGAKTWVAEKKSRASMRLTRMKQAGIERAAAAEKRLEAGEYSQPGRKMWDRFQAFAFSPADRADKKAADWQQAAENVKAIYEKNLKTSHTLGGLVKLQTSIELSEQEKLSSTKKNQKEQMMKTMMAAINDGADIIQLREQFGDEEDAQDLLGQITKLQGQMGEGRIGGVTLAEAADRYMGKREVTVDAKIAQEKAYRRRTALAGETALDRKEQMEIAQIESQKKMDGMETQAALENLREQQSVIERRALARERAAVFTKNGQFERSAAVISQTEDAIAKEAQERMNMPFEALMEMIGPLMKEIKENQDKMDVTRDRKKLEALQADRNALIRRRVQMTTALQNHGASHAATGEARALSALGYGEDFVIDDSNRSRVQLELLAGRRSKTDENGNVEGLESLKAEIDAAMGANAAERSSTYQLLHQSAKKAASGGFVGVSGGFKASFDRGQLRYDLNTELNPDYNWHGNNNNLRDFRNAAGFADRTADGRVAGWSSREKRKGFASLFRNKSKQSISAETTSALIESMKKAVITQDNEGEYIQLLEELAAEIGNADAFTSLVDSFGAEYKKLLQQASNGNTAGFVDTSKIKAGIRDNIDTSEAGLKKAQSRMEDIIKKQQEESRATMTNDEYTEYVELMAEVQELNERLSRENEQLINVPQVQPPNRGNSGNRAPNGRPIIPPRPPRS